MTLVRKCKKKRPKLKIINLKHNQIDAFTLYLSFSFSLSLTLSFYPSISLRFSYRFSLSLCTYLQWVNNSLIKKKPKQVWQTAEKTTLTHCISKKNREVEKQVNERKNSMKSFILHAVRKMCLPMTSIIFITFQIKRSNVVCVLVCCWFFSTFRVWVWAILLLHGGQFNRIASSWFHLMFLLCVFLCSQFSCAFANTLFMVLQATNFY